MREILLQFPKQLKEGYTMGVSHTPTLDTSGVSSIIFSGIGGSGIVGEIIRQLLHEILPLPFLTQSSPPLSPFVDTKTLFIVSSYSGNTPETLSMFREAKKKKAPCLVLTSGGELQKFAQENNDMLILVPGGLQPRAALGYLVASLLGALEKLFAILSFQEALCETVNHLETVIPDYAEPDENNFTYTTALSLTGTIPIVYGTENLNGVVARRMKSQFNENSKNIAMYGIIPEVMHNELVGFKHPFPIPLSYLFLRDPNEPVFYQTMIAAFTRHLQNKKWKVFEMHAQGTSLLCRILSLVVMGDWLSYYLALANQEDPTHIPTIRHYKHLFRRLECTM